MAESRAMFRSPHARDGGRPPAPEETPPPTQPSGATDRLSYQQLYSELMAIPLEAEDEDVVRQIHAAFSDKELRFIMARNRALFPVDARQPEQYPGDGSKRPREIQKKRKIDMLLPSIRGRELCSPNASDGPVVPVATEPRYRCPDSLRPRHGTFYSGTDMLYGRPEAIDARPNLPLEAAPWPAASHIAAKRARKLERMEENAVSVAVMGEGKHVTTVISRSGRSRRAVSFGETDGASNTSGGGGDGLKVVEGARGVADRARGVNREAPAAPWTEEEEHALAEAVGRLIRAGGSSWTHVASAIGGGRSNNSCRHRWNACKRQLKLAQVADKAAERAISARAAMTAVATAGVDSASSTVASLTSLRSEKNSTSHLEQPVPASMMGAAASPIGARGAATTGGSGTTAAVSQATCGGPVDQQGDGETATPWSDLVTTVATPWTDAEMEQVVHNCNTHFHLYPNFRV